MSLKSKLASWVKNDLITESQSQSIFDFEQANHPLSKFISTIVTLGVIVVVIGIISLIAANWYGIHAYVKLFSAIIILVALSYASYQAMRRERIILFEALILLINLFILAFIGLIAQIYNLSGDLWQTMFLWSFIAIPVVILSSKTINYFITIVAILFGSVLLLDSYLYGEYIYLLPVALVALMIFLREKLSAPLTKAIFISCIGFSTILVNMVYLDYTKSVCGLISIPVLMLFIALSKKISRFNKFLYSIILLFYTFTLIASQADYMNFFQGSLLKAFAVIGFLFTLALLFAVENKKICFNVVMFLIGWKFFLIYTTIFKDMITTGLGLIFSGLLILFLAWLGSKYKDKLMNLVRRYSDEAQ